MTTTTSHTSYEPHHYIQHSQPEDSGRDCTVFLVDCEEHMFRVNSLGEIPFNNAISACIDIISTKLICRDDDLIGVCLYDTSKTKGLPTFDATDNIYVLIPPDNPDPSMLVTLEKMNEPGGYDLGHCNPDQVKLEDALWVTSHMFSSAGQKIARGGIYLMTVNDSPHAASIQAVKTRVEDLDDNNIQVDPFFLRTDFDFKKFYTHVIPLKDDDEEDLVPNRTMETLQDLRSETRRKQFKKRAFSTITMNIGDAEIGLKSYNLVVPQGKPVPSKLHFATNMPVVTRTTKICESTGDALVSEQIGFSQKFGGRTVVFDKEEVASMKKFGDPGIIVLGFKPRSAMKNYHNIKHASFLYPDDERMRGSDTAFAALLQALAKTDKVAIATVVLKSGMQARLAALYPQVEEYDDRGVQRMPPGMHVIWLPFADDIRKLELPARKDETTPSSAQVKKAEKVIDALTRTVPFNPFDGYTNPDLQTHYAALQAVAMNRDDIPQISDDIMYDKAHFKRHQASIDAFLESVVPGGYDASSSLTKTKRPRADGEAPATQAASKRQKSTAASVSDGDMKAQVQQGTHGKNTVPILKAFLASCGIAVPSGSKKADLVQLVEKWAEK